MTGDVGFAIRLDKWLWFARFFKTRGLATRLVASGRVRVNGVPVSKASALVRAEDVVTFAQGDCVRVVRVLSAGARRGPAPEAASLYADLRPAAQVARPPPAPRFDGGGRPTKKDRRDLLARGDLPPR